MSLFKGYERPEGAEPGHIDVLVRENVVEQYGLPTVDFDNLSRMYSDELGLEAGKWAVKLFHGRWSGHVDQPLSKLSLGYHVPGTKTIHSAVWSGGYHFSMGHGPERSRDDATDTMRKLVRQSIGVAEGRKQSFMLAKERALHIGPPLAALAILEEAGASPMIASFGPVPIGWFAIKSYFDRKNARREARETEVHANHKYDIIFPDTPY